MTKKTTEYATNAIIAQARFYGTVQDDVVQLVKTADGFVVVEFYSDTKEILQEYKLPCRNEAFRVYHTVTDELLSLFC